MPVGPGKYDEHATGVRQRTGAKAVVLVVLEGYRGSGFSVQAEGREIRPGQLAQWLRTIADELDRAAKSEGP